MKVYISKSNNGIRDLVTDCREYMRKKGYIQLEYVGGRYDPNVIKSADMVTVVPMQEIGSDGAFIVGKGQWGESDSGIKTVVYHKDNLYPIVKREVIDLTNYQKTGKLFIDLSETEPLLYR